MAEHLFDYDSKRMYTMWDKPIPTDLTDGYRCVFCHEMFYSAPMTTCGPRTVAERLTGGTALPNPDAYYWVWTAAPLSL